MTEQDDTEVPQREIEFQGRAIWVKMPLPEQLLVWQRTLTRLQTVEVDSWNADQMMKALERLRLILDSVLLNAVDIDWMDDEMLAGRLGLQEMGGIITLTAEAFATEDNRAARRAKKTAPPAKKAARKKVTPK